MWDTERLKQVRNMKGHKARVGSLAWNEYMLSSGSRDSAIHNHDVRVAQHHISTLEAHRQEVCGLKWCQEGRQLASGGNDNLLHIWDVGRNTPRFTLENHQVRTPTHSMCACLLHGYPDSKYLCLMCLHTYLVCAFSGNWLVLCTYTQRSMCVQAAVKALAWSLQTTVRAFSDERETATSQRSPARPAGHVQACVHAASSGRVPLAKQGGQTSHLSPV